MIRPRLKYASKGIRDGNLSVDERNRASQALSTSTGNRRRGSRIVSRLSLVETNYVIGETVG